MKQILLCLPLIATLAACSDSSVPRPSMEKGHKMTELQPQEKQNEDKSRYYTGDYSSQ